MRPKVFGATALRADESVLGAVTRAGAGSLQQGSVDRLAHLERAAFVVAFRSIPRLEVCTIEAVIYDGEKHKFP